MLLSLLDLFLYLLVHITLGRCYVSDYGTRHFNLIVKMSGLLKNYEGLKLNLFL